MSTLFQTICEEILPAGRQRSNTFRGSSASRAYATRVRWLVGGLLSLVALLVTALVLLFHQYGASEVPPNDPATAVTAAQNPALSPRAILIARQRIEAGARIEPVMFEEQEVNSRYMPEGAVLASERDSVLGFYAKEIINTGFPISRSALSATQLTPDEIFIPDGYRAIAIGIDEVSSVAYAIRPNNRVDVVLSYTYKGQPAVVTIVPTAKVLSMGTNTNPNGKMEGARSATLLVTPGDARKIELSKKLGTLSLVLASGTEVLTERGDPSPTLPPEIFGPGDTVPKSEPRVDGTMVVMNPKTGEPEIYHLLDGKWSRK